MDGIGQGRPAERGCASGAAPEAALRVLCERIPPTRVRAVLRQTGRQSQRVRRLPAAAVVWLVIALGLFSAGDVPTVWRQVVGTLRMLRQAGRGLRPPVKSAFSAARARLGPRPLRRLFREAAGPIADERTPGAFYKGLRLMVIDAVSVDAPDTPANRAAFGGSSCRIGGRMFPGAYPRPTLCLLEEAGTRTVCEALIRPFKCDEVAAGSALLRRVPPGSLVLWDRRYYARYLLGEALERGVHVLGRLSSQPVFTKLRELPDGSILARIDPARPGRRHPPPMTVRVIRYTLDDPNRPGHGEVHRLVTTLLDETRFPARELVELYHQRWEIEISNDEVKTHQLAASRPTGLRSLTPRGIVQEVYGLLLAYNGVRWVMHRAAQEQGQDPRRLSFTHAVRVIRDAAPLLQAARPPQRPVLLHAMLRQIAQHTLPPPADRVYPRVVKRKMSHFLAKRPEHLRPPQPTKAFANTIVILK
jgi:transposase IS4-like protein/DDE family transposase